MPLSETAVTALPRRAGPPPRTTSWAPHVQLDQLAPPAMHAALMARVFALQGVEERPGTVADPRESAIWLRTTCRPDRPTRSWATARSGTSIPGITACTSPSHQSSPRRR